MLKLPFLLCAFILLIYLLLPGPSGIDDFPPLPNSLKSTLEGDTIQVKNVAGYFSNNYRQFVTNYYRRAFQQKTWFPFAPLRLNYPPEYAYTVIKDQTHSTYLEEYVYPLRESLYVNGLELYNQDGSPKFWGSTMFEQDSQLFYTKATLRYYPSSYLIRLVTWLGIICSIALFWNVSKKVLRDG